MQKESGHSSSHEPTLPSGRASIPELHRLIAAVPCPESSAHLSRDAASDQAWCAVLERIKSHPSDASLFDSRGRTCLHTACAKHPPPSVVSSLLTLRGRVGRRGGAARFTDNQGRTALAIAVYTKADPEVIRLLLRSDPRAAGVGDHRGNLPLHLFFGDSRHSCRGKSSKWGEERTEETEATVRLLLESYPEAAGRENNAGRTPLHVAMEEEATSDVVRMLVEASPEAVAMDKCGSTPLTIAIQKSLSFSIIELLVDSNPSVLVIPDKSNYLPLRRAVVNSSSRQVVEFLCASREAVLDVDGLGRTPLQLALLGNCRSEPIVRAMLTKAPEACLVSDRGGVTPLSTACHQYVKSVRKVQEYHELSKKATKMWKIVCLLLKASYLGTVVEEDEAEVDGNGSKEWRVLHAALAVSKKISVPLVVVQTALSQHPEQVFEVDKEGRFPLSLALEGASGSGSIQSGVRDEVARLVLDADPDAAGKQDRNGRYPLSVVAASGAVGRDVAREVMRAFPDALRVPDPSTRLMPFMLAAVAREESPGNQEASTCTKVVPPTVVPKLRTMVRKRHEADLLQTTTILELLLAGPELVSAGIIDA